MALSCLSAVFLFEFYWILVWALEASIDTPFPLSSFRYYIALIGILLSGNCFKPHTSMTSNMFRNVIFETSTIFIEYSHKLYYIHLFTYKLFLLKFSCFTKCLMWHSGGCLFKYYLIHHRLQTRCTIVLREVWKIKICSWKIILVITMMAYTEIRIEPMQF